MTIRKMTLSDLEEVLVTAVTAFRDTPLYHYLAPDTEERDKFLDLFFRFRISRGFEKNTIDVAELPAKLLPEEDRKIVAASVWVPPAPSVVASVAMHLAAMPPAPPMPGISAETLERRGELYRALSAGAAKNVQEPHWNLSPIFILPSFQGKGIGSALIRKQLAVIDTAGLPVTLTTQEAKNITIYERYGFRVVSDDEIGSSGIRSWAMARLTGQDR
jgi:GNAT superfamily N-acetyltransferase